jgi:nucleoside-diphosphate-sugar epimerase
MLKMFAEEAGVELKMSSIGRTLLWIGGLFIPEAKESLEMLYEFEQPFIVDSSKFEKIFGMKASPMKQAIKETVAWFKSHPEKK